MTTVSPFPYALVGANAHPYAMVHTHQQQQHQLLCRYRSKVCHNPRAHKRDGSLHRYCEDHRQRANTNQKKWAKRRMQALDDSDYNALQLAYDHHHERQLLRHVPLSPVAAGTNQRPNGSCIMSDNTAMPRSPFEVHSPTMDTQLGQWQELSLLEFDGDMLWSVLGLDEPLAQGEANSDYEQ